MSDNGQQVPLAIRAYHFVGDELRDGRPVPPVGEWLVHDGPVKMCESGLHASRHPFDALMYAPGDPRIAGLIGLNPWVHSAQGEAQARIRGYYLKRLTNREFWGKVLRFQFDWRDSLQSLFGYARAAAGRREEGGGAQHFLARMEEALVRFEGRFHVALSGNDFTADEFRLLLKSSPAWSALAARKITLAELPGANHTFASREWRAWVEERSLDWLQKIAAG